jgi:hypothetical protein
MFAFIHDAQKGRWWSGGYVVNKNVIKHENRRPPRFSHNPTYPPNHLAKPTEDPSSTLRNYILFISALMNAERGDWKLWLGDKIMRKNFSERH